MSKERTNKRTETLACDCISRQAAIDALRMDIDIIPYAKAREYARAVIETVYNRLEDLPPAQPERLTDDDLETIRIHLNAFKEKLCNQQRWEEAEEYQRILDRFMAFATAQPDIIRCKDCKWWDKYGENHGYCMRVRRWGEYFCADAERREE